MKISGIIKYFLSVLIFACVCSICASASVWVFGSSGSGQNAFTAKGFAIKTESGKIQWLYSKFSNGGYDENGNMYMQDGGTVYTGKDEGVQYISATKADGKTYQLYAFTNRNPLTYGYMFAYQKKSVKDIPTAMQGFTSCLGDPIRTSTDTTEFPNGISTQWAVPINNFVFEPGTLYEFGFQQGLEAKNGISLVLQDDGAGHYLGYLQTAFTPDEQKLYDKMKYVEYEFISSYTQIPGTKSFNVNFVPMRFSVQTYADLSSWNAAAAKVQSFINGITQSDYDRGRYSKSSIDNLNAELKSMQNKADNEVKYELKTEADQSIAEMVNTINADMNLKKSETGVFSDMTALNAELGTASDFYADAKNNVGTEVGNYKKEAVDALKQKIDAAKALTKEDLQSAIDQAVADLKNAVITVKSSQIQTDKIILNDFVNGITVTLKKGSVPDNASLIVKRMDTADQRYKALQDSIGDNVKDIVIYEILLFSGDERIQPSEPMAIQFPVPNSMADKDISVYFAGDDLQEGKISSVRTENSIYTESGSAGCFSLVSYGETVTVPDDIPQTETPADGSQTSGGSSLSRSKKASQDKVNVIKQTNDSVKDKPDEKEKQLDIIAGAGNSGTSGMLSGENRPQENIADTVIPESEILKKSNPLWMLFGAAALGVFGAVYGTVLIVRKLKSISF